MKHKVVLTYDEVHERIPFMLIAETTNRAVWSTGRRKRLWKEWFPLDAEREKLNRMKRQADQWALKTGVPDRGIRMELDTYELWQKFASFCFEL